MSSTYTSYQLIAANLPKALARAAADPVAARETKFYLANIGKVKTVDDFLNAPRLYDYALKAFGLQDIGYAKGLIRKVLEGGIDSKQSLANTLADPRYKELATAFNFHKYGTFTTGFASTGKDVADKYAAQTLELQAGEQNEAVRLALYFQRKAPTIKSAYAILADAALLKVVQTALDIDPSTSKLNIDKQAALISSRLDVKDLQNPAKLQKFLQRYTVLSDASTFDPAASPAAVLTGGDNQQGLNADLLFSLQNVRRTR
ncbi:MAG: DUF1217 domain-containing protein [Beijerinckiaceae bacterium]|nr:DUF1217 domain-containing protein [Beijerinckiaceae bacterium]